MTMPAKKKAQPKTKTRWPVKNVSFSPDHAENFFRVRDKYNAEKNDLPFNLTNTQFLAIVLHKFEKDIWGK